jgi:hypothetical protein
MDDYHPRGYNSDGRCFWAAGSSRDPEARTALRESHGGCRLSRLYATLSFNRFFFWILLKEARLCSLIAFSGKREKTA